MTDSPRSNRPTPRTSAAIEAELRRRIQAELTQARGEAEGGVLADDALAGIIARAVNAALTWHLESPEHTRNATLSSRTWRGAPGPRGGRPDSRPDEDDEEAPRGGGFRDRAREPRPFDRPQRDFGDRPPRQFGSGGGGGGGGGAGGGFGTRGGGFGNRGPRDFGNRPPRDFGEREPGGRPPRDFGNRPPRDFGDRPPRQFGPRDADDERDVPPRRSFGRPPFSPRGGRPPFPNRGGGGGFSRGGGGGFGPRRPPRPR